MAKQKVVIEWNQDEERGRRCKVTCYGIVRRSEIKRILRRGQMVLAQSTLRASKNLKLIQKEVKKDARPNRRVNAVNGTESGEPKLDAATG